MKNIHHDPHVVEPTSTHTHTLIILHGRGSNGPKFGSALLESPSTTQALTLPALIPGLKIICPTAAKRRSTVLKRVPIHQWFDIYSLVDPSEREDLQLDGLKETAAYVRSLIEIESRNIPSERIFLGGLSQGCAAAVFVLLTLEGRLGGFIGMSGWFPLVRHVLDVLERPAGTNRTLNDDMDGDDDDDPFETEAGESLSPPLQALNLLRGYIDMDPLDPDESTTSSVLQTPVLLGHGELDDKVDCCLGRQMANALKSLSMDVEFMAYAGLGHWYKVPEQVQDIAVFLLGNMTKSGNQRANSCTDQAIP